MAEIKIFVSHRIDLDSTPIENSIYVPVRCGAVLDKRQNPIIIGDNTGINISDKREYLGEFTVQYWAWKNAHADYYGLCHYRRYLSFAEEHFPTDEKSQIIEKYLSPDSIHKHHLDDPELIHSIVEKYDVLVSEYADISKMYTPRGPQKNVFAHFSAYDNLLIKKDDITLVLDAITSLYPELGESARGYFNGKNFRGFNCFILRKDLFFKLCEIETNVLNAIHKSGKIDFSNRTSLGKRFFGFITEWIYGIYIYYLEQQRKYRIHSLQMVFFENTERPIPVDPQGNSVAVIYLTNRYLLPATQTSIQSLVQSKGPNTKYDIIIMHEELLKSEMTSTESFFSQYFGISIRFVNFRRMIPAASNRLRWERSDNVPYAVAFLPWILEHYSRVIFLHSDTLVYTDLYPLTKTDLAECYLAAPKDYLRIAEMYSNPEMQYAISNDFFLKNLNSFFSTSVMLMDLKAIREHISIDQVTRYALGNFSMQTALNHLAEGHVKLLDANWNAHSFSSPSLLEISNFLPAKLSDEIAKTLSNPYVVHFPMHPKPWIDPYIDYADLFWQTARSIPMYERLVATICSTFSSAAPSSPIESKSFPHRVADKLFPVGSLRRKLLKKICPRDSKLWNLLKRIYCSIHKKRGNLS